MYNLKIRTYTGIINESSGVYVYSVDYINELFTFPEDFEIAFSWQLQFMLMLNFAPTLSA